MATAFQETRTERVVVLMTPTEKRRLSHQAQTHQMNLSEYLRSAAEDHEPDDEAALATIGPLLDQLKSSVSRAEASLDRLQNLQDGPQFDEAVFREACKADLQTRGDLNWRGIAAMFGTDRA